MHRAFPALLMLLLLPATAQAYIGPGSGLVAVIVAIALVIGVGMLIFGFVWYPLKRLLKSRKAADDKSA